MRSLKLFVFTVAALAFVRSAHADGTPVNMVFVGINGPQPNDDVEFVSPYTGTMNGQTVALFCDDLLHEVTFNQQWSANVTNLATAISSGNFSNTRFGSGISPANATVLYEETAWLVSQFNPGNKSQWVSLQHALWDLTDPAAGYTDTGNWLTWAETPENYGSVNPYAFEIVTNVGLNNPAQTQVQEFIVPTPEPGSFALLLCALGALAGFTLLRSRLTA